MPAAGGAITTPASNMAKELLEGFVQATRLASFHLQVIVNFTNSLIIFIVGIGRLPRAKLLQSRLSSQDMQNNFGAPNLSGW